MARKLSVAALAAAVALVAAAAHPAASEMVMAGRMPGRAGDAVTADAADSADVLFRAVDSDRDRRVTAAEAAAAPDALADHLPGISADDFAAFVEVADRDGDSALSRDELVDGLAAGFAVGSHPEFLELDATRRRRGFFKSIVKGVKKFGKDVLGNVKNKVAIGIRRATGKVDLSQDACVMCQYVVERLETNVRQSGVIPSMPTGDVPLYVSHSTDNPFAPYAPTAPGPAAASTPGSAAVAPATNGPQQPAAEEGKATGQDGGEKDGSFVEVAADAADPYDAAAAGVIASSRESTRVQRQMERQKYNEIYRVVDVTLDDVCEQSMPSSFYGYCKQIYQTQHDVVEGLRYQYRPADICFRVGMCGKNSYITKGIHSRYQ